jgi:hypothetical protein
VNEAVLSATRSNLETIQAQPSPSEDTQMTIFKIATICILTAGTLVAFLSTGLGSEVALAVIAFI